MDDAEMIESVRENHRRMVRSQNLQKRLKLKRSKNKEKPEVKEEGDWLVILNQKEEVKKLKLRIVELEKENQDLES